MTRTRIALLGTLTLALVGGGALIGRELVGGDASAVVSTIEKDATYQRPDLLAKAFALPVAHRYGTAETLDYQRNPSFCGPTSVVNVGRSLGVYRTQADVLDGTGIHSVFGLLLGGLTLDEEAELARKRLGRTVTVLRDLELAAFRQEMARSNEAPVRYIANFSRGPLFGRGGGHHSPIGGYLSDEDLVLVLDVNRRFRPWLVPTERLWAATRTVDRATGKPRGLLRIE